MREWTGQQWEAIHSPAGKIICSAAAGSGKTAVMIERIVRMLREGAAPGSFLVVTFTKAAASEMKQKIRERLREGRTEKTLNNALKKIDLMEITTIHSFCQDLIREEFQAAGVDPFFAVCEPARGKKLFSLAFKSACNSLQKEQDPDYLHWKRCFDRPSTEEMVGQVHAFMMSLPDPLEWLERSCEDIPLRVTPDHPWFETASRIVRERIQQAKVILNRQFKMFDEPECADAYRKVWKADSELFHVKQLWAEGQEVPRDQLEAGFMTLPRLTKLTSLEQDWKERYGSLRNELKEIMKETEPLIRMDPEMVERDFGNLKASLRGLKKLTIRTAEAFAAKKAAMRVLDFSDMEHFALKVLRDEKACASVRKRYREVFVDECQDVSQVQDAIIQQLYSPEGHLFMVGDVKQSIYRFRLADPELFLRRAEEYESPLSPGERQELQTNFRSRPEILETANTVFRDIMRRETAEMDYTDREALIPGRKTEGSHPVEVDLLEPDPARTKLESLADYTAMKAARLREEGYRFRDMVILMPKVAGDGQKLAELLEERQVPVFFDGGADFYEQREIAVFLRLLELMVNPASDGALLVVLKNAPFFFTEEELARVRLKNPGKNVPFRDAFRDCLREEGELGDRCREAEEKIRNWRQLESVSRMSWFIRFLVHDSHQYAMAGIGKTGNTARQNLNTLCRKAEEAEKGGVWSLRRFLSYVEEQAGGGDQRSASPLSEEDDVIRIMTMHKSKGLQFPVVFCLGLENRVEHARGPGAMLDAELGICLKYKRPEFRLSRDTAAHQIFSWKKEREQRAERIRLLYVAMTRAQERMILAAVGEEKTSWQLPPGEHRILTAVNYMDWIMPPLLDAAKLSTSCAQAETPWNIRVLDVNQQKTVEKEDSFPQNGEWLDSLLSVPPVDGLWKELDGQPYVSRMQKRSVTSLLRGAERELGEEEEETPEEKRIPARFTDALNRTDPGKMPEFMGPPPEKMGAWRGTVIHRFLSLADPEKLRGAGDPEAVLSEMKEKMLEDRVFTPEEGAVIRPEDAAAWFTSPLGRRMLASRQIRREWGFNYYRPDRNLLVQGVMDCVFREEDGWVLVDYKTDRIEDEESFAESYRPQLQWYAEALGDLTGIPVKEKWLYSISLRKAIKV